MYLSCLRIHACMCISIVAPAAATIVSAEALTTEINITWTHPDPESVNQFTIQYNYDIIGCPDRGGAGEVTFLRKSQFPLVNSSFYYQLTNLQENSRYELAVISINGFGETTGNTIAINTRIAGEL